MTPVQFGKATMPPVNREQFPQASLKKTIMPLPPQIEEEEPDVVNAKAEIERLAAEKAKAEAEAKAASKKSEPKKTE